MKKGMKMKFALMLACMGMSAMAFGACGLLGNESSSVESGTLAYELSEDGSQYALIGIGTCKDTDVQVPATYNGLPVTSVRYDAFDYYEKMTSIVLPDSVTFIGENAFAYCTSLQSVTFGSGLKAIDISAFEGCSALTSVSFGSNLQSVGKQAFMECESLKDVTFNSTATTIFENAFTYCVALENLDLTGVKEIGDSAFQGCVALKDLQLKKTAVLKAIKT